MASDSSCIIQLERETNALVLVLQAEDLGSCRIRDLMRLGDVLRNLGGWLTSPFLLVDLSALNYFGASLLGILAALSQSLRSNHRQLCICGDRNALVKSAELDRVIPTFATRSEARQYIAGQRG